MLASVRGLIRFNFVALVLSPARRYFVSISLHRCWRRRGGISLQFRCIGVGVGEGSTSFQFRCIGVGVSVREFRFFFFG